jgi:tetratricopeptide (TPR) repeat protein
VQSLAAATLIPEDELDEGLIVQCDRAVRTSRGGDPKRGLDLARDAHRRARAEGEPHGLLLALNTVAICLSGRGAHVLALATAMDAYKLAREIDWRAQAAHALLTLAASSYDLFESPDRRSIGIVRRCLAEALDLPDASLEVRTRNVLGIMLAWRKRFDEAYAELDRAVARVPASDGTTPVSLLAGNIANLAVRRADAARGEALPGARREAESHLGRALALALAGSSPGDELRVYYNRGWLRRQEGRNDEAIADYLRALKIATRLRNPARIADIQIGLGDAWLAMGRPREAVEAFEAAHAVGDEIRPARQLLDACERLERAWLLLEDSRGAKHAAGVARRERAVYERERAHAGAALQRILGTLRRPVSGRAARTSP